MPMTRRGFLGLLGRGMAATAAGVLVPAEGVNRVYSFLTDNPLAEDEVTIWGSHHLHGPLTLSKKSLEQTLIRVLQEDHARDLDLFRRLSSDRASVTRLLDHSSLEERGGYGGIPAPEPPLKAFGWS